MGLSSVLLFLHAVVAVFSLPPPRLFADNDITVVSRDEWGASPPKSRTILNTPVSLVVIHHTYVPRACNNRQDCSRAMRSMQNTHQNINGWVDIGYNFAVGGDGSAYEGRGWNNVGAHAVGVNTKSIGIVLIGDWVSVVPPANQLEATKKLIAKGLELGYISPDYKLIGHRQVGSTECPGEALFREISTWDRYSTIV